MGNAALDVALAYYTAWSNRNVDEAVSYFADDFVSQTPEGRKDAAAYRQFLDDFIGVLVEADLIGAFGDAETALMYYDNVTGPVPYAPAADWFRVRDGKIVELRIIFDQLTLNGAKAIAAVS
jgi:ketosteroid isomerase-like protein